MTTIDINKILFEKVKRKIGFSFKVRFFKFIFYFLHVLLNPSNYEVLPRSLKVITSASQLPEDKQPLSPDPQYLWEPTSRPSVISNGSFNERRIMARLHGSNVLRLRFCTAFVTLSSHWAIKLLIPMLQRLCCYGGRS